MTLPSFLVIGAPKAGTTSIYHYLAEHPEIYMSPIKGTNYFAYEASGPGDFPVTTLEAFEALFDGVTDERAIGDVSPACLGSPQAAGRIHDAIPSARIITVLRNPIERAFSGYMMQIRHAREDRDLTEAFQPSAIYVEGGFYYERLKRYFDLFPRAQMRTYLFDDFSGDPAALLRDLFGFIEVDDAFVPNVSVRHNVGFVPRNKALNAALRNRTVRRLVRPLVPRAARSAVARRLASYEVPALPAALRGHLADLYREDIERVQELLQRDLSCWISSNESA